MSINSLELISAFFPQTSSRRFLAGKPALVSRNVGCFLGLCVFFILRFYDLIRGYAGCSLYKDVVNVGERARKKNIFCFLFPHLLALAANKSPAVFIFLSRALDGI